MTRKDGGFPSRIKLGMQQRTLVATDGYGGGGLPLSLCFFSPQEVLDAKPASVFGERFCSRKTVDDLSLQPLFFLFESQACGISRLFFFREIVGEEDRETQRLRESLRD
jgi:hypothetical protein